MSDLPTRDELREVNIDEILFSGEYDATEAVSKVFAVAVAYLDGRLVDRETIDYEAARQELEIWAYEAEGRPSRRLAIRDIVDAALGGVDE